MTRTLVSARCAMTFSIRCALAAAVMALVLLAPPAAQAQVGNMLTGALQSGRSNGISSGKNPDDYFRKPGLAPGIPGARTTPDRAAPSDKLATDMPPTDALFDAVNRGDIAATREALSRGADLNAHSILGLTPVDLSVDLGHTSITFLLLSMRSAAPAPDAKRAAGRVNKAPLTSVRNDAATRTAPRPVARPRPQVIADDGGTPRPSVGFLGFGN